MGLLGYLFFFQKTALQGGQEKSIDAEDIKAIVVNYLEAQQKRDFESAEPLLSRQLKETLTLQSFIGTSNPHMGRFEIKETELLTEEKAYRVKARLYQEYTGQGEIGYQENDYYLKLFGNDYLIDEIKYGEYINLSQAPDWDSLLPAVEAMIGDNFLDIHVGQRPLAVWETKDITGDGIAEALISLGQGGAYTSYLTLMKIENDQPVIAQFKKQDGNIGALLFLEGASVMNGENVVMLLEENVIYSGHWSNSVSGEPYGNLTDCRVDAYQWDPEDRLFEFSQDLSDSLRLDYCQRVDV